MKVRSLGLVAYEPTWKAMKAFNAARTAETEDQLWLLEHPPVFTLGLAGRREHVLDAGDIPVIATDRGGQVTYHGPGQAVAYALVDLRRLGIGVKEMVRRIESAVIDVLTGCGINGARACRVFTCAAPRSRPSGCGCRAAAATTAWRSTWTCRSRRSRASTPAAIRGWR
jgi:lipoate-protein ligase B